MQRKRFLLGFLLLKRNFGMAVPTQSVPMDVVSRVKSSLLLGLMGDALALGGHYEYDARKIKASGGFRNFAPPGEANNGVGWGQANYHPGKTAGDLTDAGEVAIMLLAHLADIKKQRGTSYSFDSFANRWKQEIDNGYGSCNFMSVGRDAKGCPPGLKPGYINGGSRRTLEALARQPQARGQQRKVLAADVNCLVAATHFLPLLFVTDDEETLVAQARDTVYISHKNADPVAAAEFLARSLYRLTRAHNLDSALTEAAAATDYPLISTWLENARAKVREANDPTSALSREELVDDVAITSMSRLWDVGKSEPIKIGKASPTEGALPAALYFAIKYQDDPEAALIANANCGGDSAARGIVIGMLLGAGALHDSALPRDHRWVRGLNALPAVEALIEALVHVDKPAGEL